MLIGLSDHYELQIDGVRAGFYCLNTEQQLVAFYLAQQYANAGERGHLIATSECRISTTQPPYTDVGMVVAEAYRCKGVGTYMLARTKIFCYERETRPICSCKADNLGSKKAIIKAGFASRHRSVFIEFG